MTTTTFDLPAFRLPAAGRAIFGTLRTVTLGLRALLQTRPGIRHRHDNHLERLDERLRRDIGLSDCSPTPAELLNRFHRMHAAYPREHEIRLRPWTCRLPAPR